MIVRHALINALEHDGKADLQAVLGRVLSENPELRNKIKEIIPIIREVVEEINYKPMEEIKRMFEDLGITIKKKEKVEKVLPELNKTKKGKSVFRLAPYPSGPLHIGNARMVLLNDEYAKRYKGKLFLVFDDTIGSEEKFVIPEGYKLILDGLKWLDVKLTKILYKSDRLKFVYKIAEDLIKTDHAYVCECDTETLRKNRADGVECSHRNQTIKENLKKWKKMLAGKYKEGQAVVRLKTDMNHANPAFRDRVLLRVVDRKHPRVGKKYKVWPLLEFSWAVDDHLLGVTHIIRGKDLVIEDMMENFIWDIMEWKKPEFIHYGLLNIAEAKLSKTESRKAIEQKIYTGWDDPRTWSMQSLKRRGIQPEAVRDFAKKMGLSQADITVPAEILYAENRKLIDPKSNRYFAVLDSVQISVKGAPKIKSTKSNLHPDFHKRGFRKIPVDTGNIYIEKDDYDKFLNKEVGLIDLLTARIGGETEFVKKEVDYETPKIHWVSESNVKVKVVMSNGSVKTGIGEPSMKKIKKDQLIQLVRIGFCRVDKVGKEIVLYFAHK